MKKCIIVECQGQQTTYGRGLCVMCYSRAKKMVDVGKTSWDELERLGMIEGKKSDPFTKQLEKKRNDDWNRPS